LAAAFSDTEMQERMETILKPIFELRNKAASFEEFRSGLVELYPEMDSSGIENILEGTGLLSAVWGRLNMDRQ
jgi:phage gp29-like protein